MRIPGGYVCRRLALIGADGEPVPQAYPARCREAWQCIAHLREVARQVALGEHPSGLAAMAGAVEFEPYGRELAYSVSAEPGAVRERLEGGKFDAEWAHAVAKGRRVDWLGLRAIVG